MGGGGGYLQSERRRKLEVDLKMCRDGFVGKKTNGEGDERLLAWRINGGKQ